MRASLKSNVEKYIDAQRVVILDSMNYIKGYRYELFCLARNAMTTLCIIWCDTEKETAFEWCKNQQQNSSENADQIEEQKVHDKSENIFPLDLFEDYASRLEIPNPAKKWDKPLFQLRENEEIPFEDIYNAIHDTGKNKPRDPVSTKPE